MLVDREEKMASKKIANRRFVNELLAKQLHEEMTRQNSMKESSNLAPVSATADSTKPFVVRNQNIEVSKFSNSTVKDRTSSPKINRNSTDPHDESIEEAKEVKTYEQVSVIKIKPRLQPEIDSEMASDASIEIKEVDGSKEDFTTGNGLNTSLEAVQNRFVSAGRAQSAMTKITSPQYSDKHIKLAPGSA